MLRTSLPPITPSDAPILRTLLARDVTALKQLRDLFSAVVEIREKEQDLLAVLEPPSDPPVAEKASPSEPAKAIQGEPMASRTNELPPGTAARRPMRPPRPGTVRALIYQVLSGKNGVPQRRSEVVRAVAELKGSTIASCRKPVATVLRDKFDPHLVRTGYGEYAFVPNGSPAVQA